MRTKTKHKQRLPSFWASPLNNRLIEIMSDKPRERFNIRSDTGFTVFKLDEKYKIDPDDFMSMGKATPFEGDEVYGKCLLTVYDGKVVYTAE